MAASTGLMERRLQYDIAPENDEAAMWLATEATATAGAMPTKINSGVIRKPPPMPNMPDTKPTAAPIARMRKMLTGISAIGRQSCTRGRFFHCAEGSPKAAHGRFSDRASFAGSRNLARGKRAGADRLPHL